ncbi:solute carrier family 3 member 2a [Eucyclogobius newberryi]|uniref:solute carrier family 3 member 2a n=1 Tax=Eucyclogobius newberryi TaxID=166745 RepID=UPI003B5A6CB5
MTKDTVDMKEVELNEMDLEKQPMTGDGQAGEKNGTVKLKVPDDTVTFTGLSKEELMKVAGTPGWVRTRWLLLILFWLGWMGMLAGAIVIIVKAPPCKPIPEMNWWNEGPLYQIPDLDAFADGLSGVETKLDNVNQLKVKGLIIGPLHTVQKDQPSTLSLKTIDPTKGSEAALLSVMEKAHKKGISVVLDLTPNYEGSSSWFTAGDEADVLDKVMEAAVYWLNLGMDGIKVCDVTVPAQSLDWSKLKAVVRGNRTEDTKNKLLMGVAMGAPASQVSQFVNASGIDLLLSDLLSTQKTAMEKLSAIDLLSALKLQLGWGLGAAQGEQLANQATAPGLARLYQLLLFTMPGTPVFNYGDEIGLMAEGSTAPKMVWDIEKEPAEGSVNETAEALRTERVESRKWFKALSDLRGKERSLLHGDFYRLEASSGALSYLRLWDQSERYVTILNFGSAPETVSLKLPAAEGVQLPEEAKVKLSTDPELKPETMLSLDTIKLGPGQGVLLQFPYAA